VQISFDVLGLACNDLLLICCCCCSSSFSSLIFSPKMSTITDVLANWFLAVAKVAEYKTTAIWLAVLLALTYVGIAVTAAFIVHKRWKAKKAASAALLETKMSAFPSANLTHPGSDF
jgi:hypothetical protein